MSKSKKKRRSKSKKRTKRQKTSTSTLKKSEKSIPKKGISFLWKVFAGFAVILGVIVALYPKVSVEPDSYLDPKNPLKTLFIITNEGFLPLHNVKIYSSIQEIKSNDIVLLIISQVLWIKKTIIIMKKIYN